MKRRSGHAELGWLFKETVSLYLRLTSDASAIHGHGALSGPRRTVLTAFAQSGPQTVARLARSRAQSRQRLQPLINGLVDAGLLKAVANPMHVRSPLMMLTPKGEKEARDIAEREEALMAQLQIAASPQRMADAAAVLQSVRQAIEQQLPALLARAESRKSRR